MWGGCKRPMSSLSDGGGEMREERRETRTTSGGDRPTTPLFACQRVRSSSRPRSARGMLGSPRKASLHPTDEEWFQHTSTSPTSALYARTTRITPRSAWSGVRHLDCRFQRLFAWVIREQLQPRAPQASRTSRGGYKQLHFIDGRISYRPHYKNRPGHRT